MSIATLNDIITKVRRLTGSANDYQLTNAQIIDYINSFYLYDFPAQFRSLKLKDKYVFTTQRGIDTYPFDWEHYTTIQQPAYCAKREIALYYNPWNFWGVWFNWQYQENFALGTGSSVTTYTGTTTATPIIRSYNNNPAVESPLFTTNSSVTHQPTFPQTNIGRAMNILITANTSYGTSLNVTDDGAGGLIGDIDPAGTNTINYETGAISVKFGDGTNPLAIPANNDITIQYNPASMAIPQSILFFQNQFTLRPVPDRGYTIELVAYRQPSQAILGSENPDSPNLSGTPELLEWWECLAFGAAKKIYEDRLDDDGVALMNRSLEERYQVAYTRTYAELGKQRMSTIFADQLSNNYGASYGWIGSQGSN